jgi:hypothetical protein
MVYDSPSKVIFQLNLLYESEYCYEPNMTTNTDLKSGFPKVSNPNFLKVEIRIKIGIES